MSVLQAMISNGVGQRRADDFYPTPPEATQALLPLIAGWPTTLWEPACGDGAMAVVLMAAGYDVRASDLIDRGFGVTRDFLTEPRPVHCFAIITNPPFKFAAQFIERADELGATHLALLLKANFWSAAARLKTWDRWAPYAALPLTWRLDFTGAGSPHTDCTWFLWDRTSAPLPRPLAKPVALGCFA